MREAFAGLQEELLRGLSALDGKSFVRDAWVKPPGGALEGGGVTCVLEGGGVFERGGVALSDVKGAALPPAATQRNPHLSGRSYRAMGVSLVVHPTNPNVPTAHLNVRSFRTDDGAAWWFGGGFDLTPYFYEPDDEAHWRRVSRQLCASDAMYERLSADCDAYFTLKHRNERRGLGGLFFDDLNEAHPFGGGFEHCFAFTLSVGRAFLEAYAPIVERRRAQPYTEADRAWQAYRRGRYVEFNLVWDRGTLFGLQSGGRTESILMSMPPHASWQYGPPVTDARQRRLVERLTVSPTAGA
ncbi:MAG: oxygen-dependent coproporphyrinogen oxidase [Myxococcus sp.]|nr:oxygen-dependent coproporphyrinogen oxidase [Myxococcus sp.]